MRGLRPPTRTSRLQASAVQGPRSFCRHLFFLLVPGLFPCPDHFRSGPLVPSRSTPPGPHLPTHPAVPVVPGSGRSRRNVWSSVLGQGLVGGGGGGVCDRGLAGGCGGGPETRGLGARVRLSWLLAVSPLKLYRALGSKTKRGQRRGKRTAARVAGPKLDVQRGSRFEGGCFPTADRRVPFIADCRQPLGRSKRGRSVGRPRRARACKPISGRKVEILERRAANSLHTTTPPREQPAVRADRKRQQRDKTMRREKKQQRKGGSAQQDDKRLAERRLGIDMGAGWLLRFAVRPRLPGELRWAVCPQARLDSKLGTQLA